MVLNPSPNPSNPQNLLLQTAAAVLAHGGRIEVRKDGELVVALPATLGAPSAPVEAARVLYLAHREVIACLTAGKPLPDREVLPSGVVA